MVTLQIYITGDTDAKLERLAHVISPGAMGVWLSEQVEPILKNRARQRFKTEGDDASGKWAKLTDATQNWRATQGFSPAHPINVRTGQLQDYIENSDGRVEYEGEFVTLSYPGQAATGTTLRKLMGAQQGEGRAPARPVLAVNSRDASFVMGSLESYIRTGIGEV